MKDKASCAVKSVVAVSVAILAAAAPVYSLASPKEKSCSQALATSDFSLFQMKSLWPNTWEQLRSIAEARGITPSELVKQYFRAALKSPAFPKQLDPAQFRKAGEGAVSQLRGIEDASQPTRVDNGSTFRVNLVMRGLRTLAQAMMPEDAACMKSEQSLFSPACLKTLFEMLGSDAREEEGPAPDLI